MDAPSCWRTGFADIPRTHGLCHVDSVSAFSEISSLHAEVGCVNPGNLRNPEYIDGEKTLNLQLCKPVRRGKESKATHARRPGSRRELMSGVWKLCSSGLALWRRAARTVKCGSCFVDEAVGAGKRSYRGVAEVSAHPRVDVGSVPLSMTTMDSPLHMPCRRICPPHRHPVDQTRSTLSVSMGGCDCGKGATRTSSPLR